MTEQAPGGGTERGGRGEASGAPLTPDEEEASRRPASDQPHEEERGEFMAGSPPAWGGQRPEEFNPDDFE